MKTYRKSTGNTAVLGIVPIASRRKWRDGCLRYMGDAVSAAVQSEKIGWNRGNYLTPKV